jgi:excisionase family DNA binding protein
MNQKTPLGEGSESIQVSGQGGRMNEANPRNLIQDKPEHPGARLAPSAKTEDASQRTRLVACLLLVPSDAEPIVALLEQLAASSQVPIPFPSFSDSERYAKASIEDHWLEHGEAAKCLGVSKSTLYRYVCQRRIESRKIAGRLEYRKSVLEKLKRDQTRPARLSRHAGDIIPAALHSGK